MEEAVQPGEGARVRGPLQQEDRDDDLRRLVREVNEGGVSYQKMADRATAAGHPISKPYLQKVGSGTVATAPDPEQLRGIAAATGRPLSVVQRAAAVQFLDYRTTELSGYDDDVRVIVAHLAGMTTVERRRWRRMIEAFEQAGAEDV
jgi:hypothetical protein